MAALKRTLVLGASENPERYSHKAIKMLRKHAHPVVAIGSRKGQVADIFFSKERPNPQTIDIHSVTIYLNPTNQVSYYDYIFDLHPKRIIFNPGAENPELEKLAQEKDIETMNACTLVLLSTNQF